MVTFGFDLWQFQCITSKLLDVVEHFSDSLNWDSVDLIHPVVNDFEQFLRLVCSCNIPNDVLLI